MRIKANVDLNELIKLGFENPIDYPDEYKNDWGDHDYTFDDKLVFYLESSRRGQSYYLLVDVNTRNLSLYATKPDGDGGAIDFSSNIILKLHSLGYIEERV